MNKTYNVIVKVLCPECQYNKDNGQRILRDCSKDDFIKYRNVTSLLKLGNWLDKNKPNWVWIKVYDPLTPKGGEPLRTFTSSFKVYVDGADGKKVCVGTKRDVPTTHQL